MTDFAKLAADTTVSTEPEFPATASARGPKVADPALVQLVTDAAADHKRRDLPGRFSTKPYAGRVGANECQSIVNELHRAARSVGCKLQCRRFDETDKGVRLTFKVAGK